MQTNTKSYLGASPFSEAPFQRSQLSFQEPDSLFVMFFEIVADFSCSGNLVFVSALVSLEALSTTFISGPQLSIQDLAIFEFALRVSVQNASIDACIVRVYK